MVSGLNDFFGMMNGMATQLFDLAWIKAVVLFFNYVGWALFLAGVAVSIFDAAIQGQSSNASIRDTALNLIKGFLVVSLFTAAPIELFKTCVSLQGRLGAAICSLFAVSSASDIGLLAQDALSSLAMTGVFAVFMAIAVGYCVIKVFFASLKRGGILLISIAVGSLHMLSVPRGYTDGFYAWCKQVAALCLTAVLQTTILTAGLLTFSHSNLLGVGLMLSAKEVPRIAERFGLDTSAKVNLMSSAHAVSMTTNVIKGIAKAVK